MRDDETTLDDAMLDDAEATDMMFEMDGATEATDDDVEGLYAILAKLNASLRD